MIVSKFLKNWKTIRENKVVDELKMDIASKLDLM